MDSYLVEQNVFIAKKAQSWKTYLDLHLASSLKNYSSSSKLSPALLISDVMLFTFLDRDHNWSYVLKHLNFKSGD